ncbi:carbonic anhydrase 2 [Drosophila biarmipes]|uniref:carbonic anhydrase 2 n=1 Tax=Drosophila biarmipes TaxID=125945 RepID=UPI0007E73C9D|nr:carbonic anhydrase 2 [Drosophila biarmipes]
MFFFSCLLLLAISGCTFAYIDIPEAYLAAIRQDRADDQAAGEYNYDEQGDDWTGTCQTGEKQSPIDLIFQDSKITSIPRLRFYNYDQALQTPLVIVNNGHTANMVIPPTRAGQRASINGSLLPGNFEVQSVHFHWGSRNTNGSEHAINFERYDVEMHIVHKNTIYDTMAEATQHSDGLAVLGVMFRATANPTQISRLYGLNKVFNRLPRIVQYNSNATITGRMTVGLLLGSIVTGEFFTYNGSLTTPDCAESVTWTVFPDVIYYPRRQIEKLWNLKDSRNKPLIDNYRNIQDTNDRDVYYRTF